MKKHISSFNNGLLIGIIMLGLSELTLFCSGLLIFTHCSVTKTLLLYTVFTVLLTALAELALRGIIYNAVKKKSTVAVAVIFTSSLYTLICYAIYKLTITAILNALLMSVFLSLTAEALKSVAAPIAVHTVWSVVGGNVLGCVNTKANSPSLLEARFLGDGVITGGGTGLNASAVTFVVYLVMIFFALFYIISENRSKIPLRAFLNTPTEFGYYNNTKLKRW